MARFVSLLLMGFGELAQFMISNVAPSCSQGIAGMLPNIGGGGLVG